MFPLIDPATDQVLERIPAHSAAEVEARVARAQAAQAEWRALPFSARAEVLRAAAERLRDEAAAHAGRMAREMGKVLAEGRAEAEKCAWVLEHYAAHAEAFLADEPVEAGLKESRVVHRPLGVVLAIMPWNFPYWQVFRFAAPGLMAGNAVLLKHAPRTMGCGLAIEALMLQAGLPQGVLQALCVEEAAVPALIADPRVAAVTMTGSERGGRAIGGMAGAALKKSVLELGGSDAYLVLDDADVGLAVDLCAKARLLNAGQSCIAAKRFIVLPKVRADFEAGLVERFRKTTFGDPTTDVSMGPMARHDLRDQLHAQVEASVAGGARVAVGGAVPEGPGSFYPATVLVDVPGRGVPAADEELFGPVAAIIPVRDEAEAVAVANGSRFGLGGAVFTRDEARGLELATRVLESGVCVVNDFVRSDPRLPFGGVKASGYGRELGRAGILEMVNIKTVGLGRSP
ncbi:MAG: NAD-dependent succinate-semialdehyde dehydrogenase [Deltaproteobacteria bacterium]|nr:NAD-dependent succinate-semialdehyde dehydrogenase [Deltaproteobacteria bacterium]